MGDTIGDSNNEMLHNNYNGNNTNGDDEEAKRAQGPGAMCSPHALWLTSCWRRSRICALRCKRMSPLYLFRCVERGEGPAAPAAGPENASMCTGSTVRLARHRTPQCTFHSSTHMPPMQLSWQMSYREMHATDCLTKIAKCTAQARSL